MQESHVNPVEQNNLSTNFSIAQVAQSIDVLEQLGQEAKQGGNLSAYKRLEAEKNRLSEVLVALKSHLTSENLLATISNRLLNLPHDQLDVGIKDILKELGNVTSVQRTYIFLLSEDGRCLSDAYEWCAPAILGHDFSNFTGIPVDSFPWSMEQFLRAKTIFVDTPNTLPKEAEPEKQACKTLKIQSYVNMPMFADNRLLGWLGFDAVGSTKIWSNEEIRMMKICCDLLASAIQRRRYDQLFFRERELSHRLTSMGTLSSGLSHELNNPLSYIIGNLHHISELLSSHPKGFGAHVTEECRELISQIQQGANRVTRIVSDLSSFVQEESSASEAVPVNIKSVLESVLCMASNQIRHRATLVCQYSDIPTVKASASQLGQVFLNLLLNASKSLPEGRADEHQITIATSNVGSDVEILFTDTGCGIPDKILPHIFDPFFTTRDIGEGNGIGLAICHRIVKSFGGRIQITSRVGEGTRVQVLLPKAKPVYQQTFLKQVSTSTNTLKILLVDDEPMILNLLRRTLSNHQLTLANNGREAIEHLGANSFDLILCDLMMPELSGMDVFAFLEKNKPNMEKNIIFITGGAFTPETISFLHKVPNQRLLKPFNPEDLRMLVEEFSFSDQ